jgi:molybdopterin molybdotransferase
LDNWMAELLSVSEAQQKLLSVFLPLEVDSIPLSQSAGRVLGAQIRATLDIPLFDNSSMDGFAVRTNDVSQASVALGVDLAVVADIPAGKYVDIQLQPGQTARIMTGAPLPGGAEAVVPVEDTDMNDRQTSPEMPKTVKIFRPVSSRENVRPRGQDVRAGEPVMEAGRRLRPQDVGFLAMLGVAQVPVHRLPRVAVFSTGDELVPVGKSLQPGKIHDSNTYTLIAQIAKYGGNPLNLGIIPDEFGAIKSCLDRAASERVDLIVSSAGVSVGAFDYVRRVVEQEGRLDFWRVNMRPGKPLAFGQYKGIPYIGLPGNPVSSFVGFEVFVRLAIVKMSGVMATGRPVQSVTLLDPIESDGRESYLRAVITQEDGFWKAHLTGHQGSGNLRSLVQANALLLVPSGVKSLPIGAQIDAWALDTD